MKHLKHRSHFTVNNKVVASCCESAIKSKIKKVQSLYCTWDHVGYDDGCRISQNSCHIILKWKNMLTDELYNCVLSISISEQS